MISPDDPNATPDPNDAPQQPDDAQQPVSDQDDTSAAPQATAQPQQAPTAENFVDNKLRQMDQQPQDPNAPKVPFQTSLKLTGEQEKKMIERAFSRKRDIENEMGRDQTLQPTWWANLAPSPNMQSAAQGFLQASTFLGKRSRFDATFMNDVSWRPWTMGVDNIFMSSNIVVPLSRRICRQMIARAKKTFFGTTPWLAVDATPGNGDQLEDDQAERIERYARFKAKESKTKNQLGRGIAQALILGECAMKTTYVVKDQIFATDAQVLVGVDGEPTLDNNGNTIGPDAQWTPEEGTGQMVLASDGITLQPDAPIYITQSLAKRQVLFEGAKTEPIYYKDLLIPLTAADVQEADTVVHIYDKPVAEFVDLVVKRGMVDDTIDARKGAAAKMLSLIQELQENDSTPKAAVDLAIRPNENFTPVPSSAGDTNGPIAEFCEFYLWYDANGDGIAENIVLICDKKGQRPIYYDYVANITTDGQRPIEIVRINPIEGRWYGLGIVELFESYQTIVDLMVNRWNFSNSRAGRVDLWSPKNTLEGDRDPNLKMGWGGTYTKKPGMKAEDILESVYLNDIKFDQFHTLVGFFMQLAMNESGVMNANDGQTAGLAASKLATGIMQIEQSGDELFLPITEDLEDPLNAIVRREVEITFANLNQEEIFQYEDGDTAGVDKITPDDVRKMKYRCSIDLTTQKNQQILQLSAQAIALVKDFYATDPNVQPLIVEFYRDQLRILAPKCNPEQVLKPMPPPVMGLGGPGAPVPTGGAAPAPKSPVTAAASSPFPAQMTQTSRPPGHVG